MTDTPERVDHASVDACLALARTIIARVSAR
jgi:hypothetical protein